MARLRLPFGEDMLQEMLEPPPQRLGRGRVSEDRIPKQRDHVGRGPKGDVGVGRLPFRTRTRLPPRRIEADAERRRHHGVAGYAIAERPVDLVREPPNADRLRAVRPGQRGALGDHRQQGERAYPREPPGAIRLAECRG